MNILTTRLEKPVVSVCSTRYSVVRMSLLLDWRNLCWVFVVLDTRYFDRMRAVFIYLFVGF